MPHKYDISICIPTYNRPDMVKRLLENIKKDVSVSYEIIVIDASNNTATKQVVASYTKVKYLPTKKGLTYQRNKGIEAATAPYILMLDDDIILKKGATEKLIDKLQQHLDYAALSAYIDNEYGKPIEKYRKLYKKIGVYESLQPGKWLYCGDFIQLSNLQPFSGIHSTDFLPAGATLFRTKVIRHIRPNQQFGFMSEDKEWTLRISKEHKIGVCGDAHMVHDHLGSNGSAFSISKQKTTNYYRIVADEKMLRKITALCFFQMEALRTMLAQCYRFNFKRFQKTAGILWGNAININKFLFN